MPERHARLGPSAAHRWIECPGSIALSEQCLVPAPSEYAEEGTIAHALAELKLRKYLGELRGAAYTAKLKKIQSSEHYNGEMEEATDFYVDSVLERLAAAGDDAELLVEQQFSLDTWVPESFGTSDAVVIGGNAIEVIDLKYGKGVRVDAKGNPQLRLYGLGAAGLFGDLYDFETVRETIIQPRLDSVSTEEIALADLTAWAAEVVVPAARLAMDNTDVTKAGDWCRFCPAKATCRTRANANLDLARMDFKEPLLLTDEEIGEVLRKAENLEKWAEDVAAYALEQALAGKHYDGWKLVEGRSVRKYVDELKVADALKKAGFDEAMLYERKLYGITAMEKIVGKKKLAETLGNLLIKPAGKPTLAPASDRREELKTAEAAAADFAEE
nr:MAG TPA: Protein of unknown function (DUF2800) [Caudoviricetes sp.]